MTKTSKTIVLLDVGGTSIKGNLFIHDSFISDKMLTFPSWANRSKEDILQHFRVIINTILNSSETNVADAVLIAFPGPFDYEKGIPLLQNVSKYETIYGIDFEKELKASDEAEKFRNADFLFMNDLDAFALGVLEEHPTLKEGKVLFITLGTGTGSAFSLDGNILKEGEGIPTHGWVYHLPFRKSILDDYLSARGLEALAKKVIGVEVSGKELFQLASTNLKGARQTFELFGQDIQEGLKPVLEAFRPKTLVLGGNITKAHQYFGPALEERLKSKGVTTLYVENTSTAAHRGLEESYRRRKQ